MRLSILHRTRYTYAVPHKRVIQSLRLTPSVCASQQVVEWTVSAEGGAIGAEFTDGAGDRVTTLTLNGPVDAVELVVQGEVETSDTHGVLRDHAETISPLVYLRETPLTALDDSLCALATSVADTHAAGSLELAHALCRRVREAVTYQPGATHHDVTAAEALAAGAGVCQDHAHVMIACAHACAMPARYVVGYLHADAEGNSHEASHAWAEIYIENLGWVGFDAANGCCPDEKYLRLGSGLDAHDAAPIRGIFFGEAGQEKMDIRVSVSAAQQ